MEVHSVRRSAGLDSLSYGNYFLHGCRDTGTSGRGAEGGQGGWGDGVTVPESLSR